MSTDPTPRTPPGARAAGAPSDDRPRDHADDRNTADPVIVPPAPGADGTAGTPPLPPHQPDLVQNPEVPGAQTEDRKKRMADLQGNRLSSPTMLWAIGGIVVLVILLVALF